MRLRLLQELALEPLRGLPWFPRAIYQSGAWRCRNSAHVAAVAKLAASSSVAVADFAPNSATVKSREKGADQ